MGRGKSYTITDYGDRIILYLHMKDEATTEEILREVKGTDFRLVDGLLFLAMNQKVRASVSEHLITWTLKETL